MKWIPRENRFVLLRPAILQLFQVTYARTAKL